MKKILALVILLFLVLGCSHLILPELDDPNSKGEYFNVSESKDCEQYFTTGVFIGILSGYRLEAMYLNNDDEIKRIDAIALEAGFIFIPEVGMYVPGVYKIKTPNDSI